MTLTSLVNETAFLSVENIIVFITGFCLTGGYHCLQGTCCLHLCLNMEQCIPLKHCNHKTIWCHNPQCDCSAMKTANLILDYSTCFFLFCHVTGRIVLWLRIQLIHMHGRSLVANAHLIQNYHLHQPWDFLPWSQYGGIFLSLGLYLKLYK